MPAESDAAGTIRVFLVDDHRVVRSGVSAYLEQVDDIEVIGEAADGRQALDRIASLEPGGNLPDVVLMDLRAYRPHARVGHPGQAGAGLSHPGRPVGGAGGSGARARRPL